MGRRWPGRRLFPESAASAPSPDPATHSPCSSYPEEHLSGIRKQLQGDPEDDNAVRLGAEDDWDMQDNCPISPAGSQNSACASQSAPISDLPYNAPDPSLNQGQNAALLHALTWIHNTNRHKQDPSHAAAPLPLNMIVHGGAGVGKSTWARALIKRASWQLRGSRGANKTVLCAAPTGVAASLLTNGRTLHNLLGLRVLPKAVSKADMNKGFKLSPLSSVKRAQAYQRFRDTMILLIDEVSMVGSFMFGVIDLRLRDIMQSDLPFGGLGIVVMGDFFQLAAVGDTPLPTAVLNAQMQKFAAKDAKHELAGISTTGGFLFEKFRMFKLTQQMRVDVGDQEHTKMVESFQSTVGQAPTEKRSFLQALANKYLTPEDVAADPSWATATIVVATNKQRHALLPERIEQYAKQMGVPVLEWIYQTPGSKDLAENEIESLAQRYPALRGYFVQGAPSFLTDNVNPSKGFANGTPATMHSVSWADARYTKQILRQMANTTPGQIIRVQVPLSMNLEVAPEHAAGQTGKDAESLIPGRIVLPMDCTSDAAIQMGERSVHFNEFAVELAFVVTFHKCQGKTMSKVILDLNKQEHRRSGITYSSLYVGLSRVRKGADVKLFPSLSKQRHHLGGLEHLQSLKPNGDLKVWLQGHNRAGEWSLALATEKPGNGNGGDLTVQEPARRGLTVVPNSAVRGSAGPQSLRFRLQRVSTGEYRAVDVDLSSSKSPPLSPQPASQPAPQPALPPQEPEGPVPMDFGTP